MLNSNYMENNRSQRNRLIVTSHLVLVGGICILLFVITAATYTIVANDVDLKLVALIVVSIFGMVQLVISVLGTSITVSDIVLTDDELKLLTGIGKNLTIPISEIGAPDIFAIKRNDPFAKAPDQPVVFVRASKLGVMGYATGFFYGVSFRSGCVITPNHSNYTALIAKLTSHHSRK